MRRTWMKESAIVAVIACALSGATCGLLWMRFGDHAIEPVFGQPVTWLVLPPILSVVCFLICHFASSEHEVFHGVRSGVPCAIVFYLAFWAPLACLIGAVWLTGATM